MASKNSLLLIIKNSGGINYNELLAKIAHGYSNINSARAALSRNLKDLLAVGLITKLNNKVYITKKGEQSINSVIKHKLVIKLNNLAKAKEKYKEIDSFVQNLQTLIERSKEDSELFSAARGSAEFTISDLEEIEEKVAARARHLEYLLGVFSKQIETLKDMDFNERILFTASEPLLKKLAFIVASYADDAVVETSSAESASSLASRLNLKAKSNSFTIKAKKIAALYSAMQKSAVSYAKLYLGPITIIFVSDNVVIKGPYSKLFPLKSNLYKNKDFGKQIFKTSLQ